MNRGLASRREWMAWVGAGGVAATGCRATPRAGPVEELDELFADLEDQSERYRPISQAEKRARWPRVAKVLERHGVDALLLEAGSTMRWLCDVVWGKSERLFCLVMLADGEAFWVSPAFEAPRARTAIERGGGPPGEVLAWDEHEYAWRPLASELNRRRVQRVAIEPRARAFVALKLAQTLGPNRVLDGTAVVRDLRGAKDERELELLRAANEITQEAIGAVAARMRPGMTDFELGRWLSRAQERLGLVDVWVLPLLGPNAALPHGRPNGTVLERGELVLVDTGGSLHGYQSDETRTWTFDAPPSRELDRAWSAVRSAQEAAFEALQVGTPCREVDAAARRALEARGFGAGYSTFAHRVGHGIGLDGHEEPYLDGGSETLLVPGMTFSDEPGVYLPGRFGIRLEDIVVVREGGPESFGTWQPSPRYPT